jgi:hypothetical protein
MEFSFSFFFFWKIVTRRRYGGKLNDNIKIGLQHKVSEGVYLMHLTLSRIVEGFYICRND